MKKIAVSAVIASVLIILITIAAVSILWAFVFPMVKNITTVNVPVSLEIVQEGYTAWDPINRLAEIQVKRGSDSAELDGFDFVFELDGNSFVHEIRKDVLLNSKGVYYFNFSDIDGNLQMVKLVPVFENNRKGDVVSILMVSSVTTVPLQGSGKNYVNPKTGKTSGGNNDDDDDDGCMDDCSFNGCIDGDTRFICGENDADSCKDKIEIDCDDGEICTDGVCEEESIGCDPDLISETCEEIRCGSVKNNCGTLVNCPNTCDSEESCVGNACVGPGESIMTNFVTKRDITWYFDKQYEVGQFANGDYWVVGPVNITEITPHTGDDGNGRIMNGSMVNPKTDGNQGFDTSAYSSYKAELNVALGISSETPLTLKSGSSLISTISLTSPTGFTALKSAEILTVLDSVPAEGSFRPSYAGNNKEILHNKNQLDYSSLGMLEPVNAPSLSTFESYFERPWIDFYTGWSGELIHPTDNLPAYGREFALRSGDGALALQLNYTDVQKEKLMISYVQVGIDFYGVLVNGSSRGWAGEGGFGSGRKWPILFAGIVLDDDAMKSVGSKSGDYAYIDGDPTKDLSLPSDYAHFGEDDQTFYVTSYDVSRTNGPSWNPDRRAPVEPYSSSNIGMPEWGIRHSWYPLQDNQNWKAEYRLCCTALAWQGPVLSALIMDAKDLWNHDALFDYMDRYNAIANGEPDPFGYTVSDEEAGWRSWSGFTNSMWDAYRDDYQ